MRKGPAIGIGIAIVIVAIGIGVGSTFTDSINFDGIPGNDQDNTMQMSDNIEITVTPPSEEENTTGKQIDVELVDGVGTGDR